MTGVLSTEGRHHLTLPDSPEPMLRGHLLLCNTDAVPLGTRQRLQNTWIKPARDRNPQRPLQSSTSASTLAKRR